MAICWFFLTFICITSYGQNQLDSLANNNFEEIVVDAADSLSSADSVSMKSNDTLVVKNDTLMVKKKSSKGLEAPVEYSAAGSQVFDFDSNFVHLYKDAVVVYQDITLKADYIKFDMVKKEVHATGLPDSSGNIAGNPVFKSGNDEYQAKELNYNFNSRKAYSKGIITEQEGGFLHSEMSKRQSNGEIHAYHNKFTTCDLEHPHFYIDLKRAIIVPNKKIISGRAYFVIEDVPLYVPVLPFGFFPTPKDRKAGILFPTWGEESMRGFYLRDLGYYWPINDYVDLTVMSELYSNGDWGVNTKTDYIKRYRFGGSFNFDYRKSISGEYGFDDYQVSNFFKLIWTHNKAKEANPTVDFRANVNMSSSGFDREFSREVEEIYNNTKSSSVSFAKRWDNSFLKTPFNISAAFNHNQNNRTNLTTVSFPNISANSGNIYLFPKQDEETKRRFYHDVRTKYTANLKNSYASADTLFWENLDPSNMETGFKHSLPITLPAKIPIPSIKIFNKKEGAKNKSTLPLSISMGYEGYVLTKYKQYRWDPDTVINGNEGGFISEVKDTLAYVNIFNYMPSFNNITLNKNLYVTFQSTKTNSKVEALRYVMMPKMSLNFTPGFKGKTPKYYRTVVNDPSLPDSLRKVKTYSIYEGQKPYSPPGGTASTSARGSINFSLDNSIEMKVKSRNDTVQESKKVKLLDNLTFRTAYDVFADSMNWSNIDFTTGTSLFNKMISARMNGVFDPYALDEKNYRFNRFEYLETGKLARMTRMTLSMTLNLGSKNNARGNNSNTEGQNKSDDIGDYEYFDLPWSFNASYNWSYSKQRDVVTITPTLTFSGSFTFTKKWGFNYSSGYDLKENEFTATSFNIKRNLHCWQMSLRVIPFGPRKFFEFRINAVASMLKDLKYDFDRSWRDEF